MKDYLSILAILCYKSYRREITLNVFICWVIC